MLTFDWAAFQAGYGLPFIGIVCKVTLEAADRTEQAKRSVNWPMSHRPRLY